MTELTAEFKYIAKRKVAKRALAHNHPEPPKIVSNVPIPVELRGGARGERYAHFYPFEDMKVGDSFWVPSLTYCTAGAITKFSKRSGWKFVQRGQAEDGTANKTVHDKTRRGTRVWRVA